MSLIFSDLRIGQGLDIHPLAKGRACRLGGVDFPEASCGPVGHSDADVLLHAVTDALLGATGRRDIGNYFPSSGPQSHEWAGADSRVLLERVYGEIARDGWIVWNLDCSVVTEVPRLAPRIDEIRASLSSLLRILPERVSVKATTAERLGVIGSGEGIVASSVVLLLKP